MLGRKLAERVQQVAIAKKEALAKSFLMSIAEKSAKVTQDLRYLNHHDKDIHKKKVSQYDSMKTQPHHNGKLNRTKIELI